MRIYTVLLAVALGSCASAPNVEFVLDRFDGKPIDPAEMARVKAECRGAALQASSTVGYQGPGLVGAVASASMQRQAFDAAAESCLARNGVRATPVVKAPPPPAPQPM